ncbi:IclR family transcriptional regulator [Streptomyces sp. NPDC050619]|uniref:IclR family transcriptional regulator n=1 Tax=Streptomyces sp. NPDC050619 TaxID=3157214 RepID=UPI0034441B89
MSTPHVTTPTTTAQPTDRERSVVDRALNILGVFDQDNRSLTLSEISRRAGLPVATAHRIVHKLQDWGALERRPDGRYSIGLKLWEKGNLSPRCSNLAETAKPYLVELHRRSAAGAALAIRDGDESVCLSMLTNDPAMIALASAPGDRLPLHATAAGLLLLAHAGEPLQNEVCAGPLRRYTAVTTTDGSVLQQQLASVRRAGYAVADGTLVDGRGAVAAPVRDPQGSVIAAVCVVAHREAFQPLRQVPLVLTAADAVSRRIQADAGRVTALDI